MVKFDVIVVGSGAAGLAAAIRAAEAGCSVAVVTKGQAGRSGATATVSGDVNVDGQTARRLLGLTKASADDSAEQYFEDTLAGGKQLNDRPLLSQMVTRVGHEVARHIGDGLKVQEPIKTPGHRFPRGIIFSGMDMMQVQLKRLRALGVKFREEFYVTDVLTGPDGAAGIFGIDLRGGEVAALHAKAVILATGGGMMTYQIQTAPEELVGDGYAIALRAGAELIDMDMVQFLPCCLAGPPIWKGIQFPWMIGPQSGIQAWLLNRYGERFMEAADPVRKEGSTRDIIAIACAREIMEGRGGPNGGVFLSWAHLPNNLIDHLPAWAAKPHLKRNWMWEGFDFKELVDDIKRGNGVEVTSASHFFMGGIAIDEDCRTAVPNLYAAGELAGGVHGANRLSGNACSQMLVQGAVAGEAAAKAAKAAIGWPGVAASVLDSASSAALAPLGVNATQPPHELMARIRTLAAEQAGIIRSGSGLKAAMREIAAIRDELPALGCGATVDRRYNRSWIEAIECASALTTLEAIAACAVRRNESRGAHFRSDHPHQDDASFLKSGYLRRQNAALLHEFRPVRGATHPHIAAGGA